MSHAPPTGSVRDASDRACRFRPVTGGGFRAALEVTRRCNIACRHCFVPAERADPPLEQLRAIIAALAAAGCRKLLLTGGEPLLRDDLEEIIATAAGAGVGVDLNSNLVGLGSARAGALARAGLREVSTSFYGGRDFHDSFVRRRGGYDDAVRACGLLRERGVEVDLHGPLWAENLTFAAHTYDLAVAIGAGSLTFFNVVAPAGGLFGGTRFGAKAEDFPPAEPAALARILGALRARGGLPVRTVGFRGGVSEECEQGCSIVGLTSDLSLSPCLLSRRREPGRRQTTDKSLAADLAALRREVAQGLWLPVCQGATREERGRAWSLPLAAAD